MQHANGQPISLTQRTLCGMLAHNLFGVDFSPESDVDWMAVLRESHDQAVYLLALYNSHEYGLPDALREKIKLMLRAYMLRDARVHAQHTEIHRILTENGIPYCILKGAVSAYYYPKPFLRGMGDVDFYVHQEDVPRVEQLLKENGFDVPEQKTEHHIVLYRQGGKFELHYELPGVPKGAMGDIVRTYQADILKTAVLTETEGATYMRPSPFHHGTVMLLHMQQHLLKEGMGLRHLCDWAVFAASFTESEFTALFYERLSAMGLWRFARIISLAATASIGLPHQSWMGDSADDRALAEELLRDILSGGNFGSKDTDGERVYESKLISNRDKSDLQNGQLKNGVESINIWVRGRWPAAEKCPLLLPFGWIYFFVRRFVLVLTGRKKRIKLKKTLQNSRQRQHLYHRLGLFEKN